MLLFGLHLLGLVVAAVVSLAVARWIRQLTRDRAGTMMFVLLVVHALMALLVAGQLVTPTLEGKMVWYRLWYTTGLAAPVVWFLVATYYTGRERWLTKPVWALLLASVVVPVALWLTDPVHGLFVASYGLETAPFVHLRVESTPAVGPVVILLNLYTLAGFGMFVRMFLFARRNTRWQLAAVLAGMVAIFVPFALSSTPLVPLAGFPYGVIGSVAFGVLVGVALFRTRMFAVAPLARDAVFESMEDAILVVDARLAVVDFNGAAVELFPSLGRHLGEPLTTAYPGLVDDTRDVADGGGVEAVVEQIGGTLDAPFAGEVEVARGETTRTLRTSASEVTSGGEPRGYVLVLRDVTELETYATELEHRTDQLERFASMLSHDLRNPLAVATGYVEQAKDTREVEQLDDALTALERIDDTIESLLALSREGRTIDDPESVSLATVVDDAWATSDTGTQSLRNDIDPDRSVRADPDRLKTLFENLYRNAADHGGETVRVGPLDDGFFVTDDGPGIPEEDRDRIFEYGYSSGEGTGLGLSIVAAVANAHGWSIATTGNRTAEVSANGSPPEGSTGGARFEFTDVDAG